MRNWKKWIALAGAVVGMAACAGQSGTGSETSSQQSGMVLPPDGLPILINTASTTDGGCSCLSIPPTPTPVATGFNFDDYPYGTQPLFPSTVGSIFSYAVQDPRDSSRFIAVGYDPYNAKMVFWGSGSKKNYYRYMTRVSMDIAVVAAGGSTTPGDHSSIVSGQTDKSGPTPIGPGPIGPGIDQDFAWHMVYGQYQTQKQAFAAP